MEVDLQKSSKFLARIDEPQAKRPALPPVKNGQMWWTRAAVDTPSDAMSQQRPRSNVPTLHMERLPEVPATATRAVDATETRPKGPAEDTDETPQEGLGQADAPLTPQGVLQELAKQYMEALYMSRTSLAYFTKGPLSRARVAFVTNFNPEDFGEFLRDSILPSNAMDKKFRNGISLLVRDLPIRAEGSPEKPTKKRKKKWKAKRDKNGFFAGEDEYVESWWRTGDENDSGPSSPETIEAALRGRLPRIRNRETLLQIILALEILALEASHPSKLEDSSKDEYRAQETQREDYQPAPGAKKPKPKRRQDLAALLETLIDRLCIWHSLEVNSPVKKRDTDGEDTHDESNNDLKSFCIEVIIPLYTSRIPQYATIVNKKLGGPSAPTPIKRKTTTARKPGEPATRQPPEKKPRKPLARVSTDTMDRSGKHPPCLQRSATASKARPLIKREASEVPLHSIPFAKPQHSARRTPQQRAAARNKPSLMSQISFSKREVDLSAMSQANEAKMRKKAEVDEKLREAISTLKKPNRAMAVKEIADSTDESFAKAAAKGRRNPVQRMKVAQSVHVTATPKHVRTINATPHKGAAMASDQPSRSSGFSYVPSSSARLLAQRNDVVRSSLAVPQTGHRPRHGAANIEETPSRGFAKFMPPGLARQPGTLNSPIAQRTAGIQATPSKPVKSLALSPPVPSERANVNSAPIRAPTQPLADASPNASRCYSQKVAGEAGKPKSVYDALGWDEEYEDLSVDD